MAIIRKSAAMAARSIVREKPVADSAAPRSDTKTNGEAGLSR